MERITSSSFNAHIDQYSSYESSVAWSPDSREVAFVAFAKGRNRLIIANTHGKIRDQIDLPGLSGFSNPAWSPDGNTIVVTGIKEGQSDLYAYELHTKKIRALTNDLNADLQASFSPDGKWLVFTRDHANKINSTGHHYTHSLALINMANGELSELDVFSGANNMNPVFAPDGQTIYFLSDHDGFRNLYQYGIGSRELSQLTDFFTGISGITAFAPAISVSRKTGQVMYSYYSNGDYTIYSARPDEFKKITPSATVSQPQAAVLPPVQRAGTDMVQNALLRQAPLSAEQMTTRDLPYQSKFELDYLGNTGVGLQTGGGYGTGLAGGVNGIFSDMLGNHQLFGGLSLNGELVDVAAQTAYLNQKKRLNWGTSLSHIPYLSGAQYLFRDTILDRNQDSVPVLNYSLDLLRTFQDQLSVFASYPFSTIRRVEAGASFARYYYRLDRYTEYYDETGMIFYGNTREKQPVPSGFNLGQGYVALVGDNSFFGVASPLAGHRFRVEAGQFMGAINLTSLNGDYRKYFRFAPITLATRNM